MRVTQRWLWAVLLVGMLVLTACGGATPEAEPEAESGEPVATQEATPADDAADDTDAADDSAEEANDADAADDGDAADDAASDDGAAAGEDFSEARTIDEVESINSYRADITIRMEGEAFEADSEMMAMMGEGITVSIEAVKEPPAQRVNMNVGPLGDIGFIVVDGKAYSGLGGQWFESSPEEAPDISELTAGLDAEAVGDDLEQLERVGEEELNGRDTIHYRGDREAMAAMADDEGSMEEIEEGEIDVWIDQEEGFIVRMLFEGTGTGLNPDEPELSGSLFLDMNYYDFNEEITIEAPEGAMSMDDMDTESLDLGGDPAEALGFALTDLPSDVTVEAFGNIVTFTLPDASLEEATSYIEGQLSANGFTLNEDTSFPDQGILSYEGDGSISVVLTESGEGIDVLLTKE